ncbi:glycosyltransferase [archaeon]|nr:MAG: glycosyltransferase [archaeon]
MRVCFIGKYQPGSSMAGGIEKYADDLTSCGKADFKPIYFGNSKGNMPVKFTVLEAPFSSPKLFLETLSKTKSDIIHINIPNPFSEIMLLLHILLHGNRQKIVATYHADAPHYTLTSYFADALRMVWLMPLLMLSDKIISTSQRYAESSFALRPFMNKVMVIPLGVDTKKVPIRKTVAMKSRNRKIIFIGRLYRYKGLDVLLDAFNEVAGKIDDVELFIVGTGPMKDMLVDMSKRLGIEDSVTFTDRLGEAEKNQLLKESDIFILPSVNRGEAFGVSQLDAMYFSKPVISTDINGSGVSFVNKDGKTGLVVEPNNPRQLADAMIKLLKDDSLRMKMGVNGKKRVLRYFTRDIMVKKTLDVYKSLV